MERIVRANTVKVGNTIAYAATTNGSTLRVKTVAGITEAGNIWFGKGQGFINPFKDVVIL